MMEILKGTRLFDFGITQSRKSPKSQTVSTRYPTQFDSPTHFQLHDAQTAACRRLRALCRRVRAPADACEAADGATAATATITTTRVAVDGASRCVTCDV